jgi:hypothetical protein
VAPADDLVAHERDVRGRAAEADEPELREQERDFSQRPRSHAHERTIFELTQYIKRS